MAEGHRAPVEVSGSVPRFVVNPKDFIGLHLVGEDEDRACWVLYRQIVGTVSGWWPPEHAGVEEKLAIARRMRREQGSPLWRPVEIGEERPLDLVLMRGQAGHGRDARLVPMHVGCVVRPGLMLDAEKRSGVMLRAYRSTSTFSAHPKVKVRFIRLYRPEALA